MTTHGDVFLIQLKGTWYNGNFVSGFLGTRHNHFGLLLVFLGTAELAEGTRHTYIYRIIEWVVGWGWYLAQAQLD